MASRDIHVIMAQLLFGASCGSIAPLMEATQALPRVQLQDLHSSYPDYAIDVDREQAALAQARLVLLRHPIQWYSMPAMQHTGTRCVTAA
ncbi:NAD(P)H-dependent oxidoreductase [Polaromonas sp. UBA4122]|uniref:NAD(P)H-dependent oxidoreductase n=1 Tax=Polaromonas sp. UBA4122 TaxID=1947074 RepID=UPI0025F4C750|nr:NAD(P)H-dependent oxidoreductase [Polaromonas sp. UBA4122]